MPWVESVCDAHGEGFWRTGRAPGESSPRRGSASNANGARLVRFHGARSSGQFSGAVTGRLPSGGTLSPLDFRHLQPEAWVAVPEWEKNGAWDEEPGKGERASLEGKSGPRQAQGGARRGAQGRRAGGSPGG